MAFIEDVVQEHQLPIEQPCTSAYRDFGFENSVTVKSHQGIDP
jgi:hypothetical protein